MLIKKEENQKVILIPCRENKKERVKTNIDDGLFDDDDIPCEYYETDIEMLPAKEKETEKTKFSKLDFQYMDLREIYFNLYNQLLDIKSTLSDIKEVLNNEY